MAHGGEHGPCRSSDTSAWHVSDKLGSNGSLKISLGHCLLHLQYDVIARSDPECITYSFVICFFLLIIS